MRTRAGALVAGLVMAGAALLGAAVDDGFKVSPPATKNGVTCSVTAVGLNTTLITDVKDQQANHGMYVTVTVEGGGGYFACRSPGLTSVLDEREMEILHKGGTADSPEEYRRQAIVNELRGAMQMEGNQSRSTTANGSLKRFPAKIMRATGSMPVLVAKRLVREKVKMEEGAEAVEIAPGVTFLMSKVERTDDHVNFSYEVRIRRGIKGVKPGYEPVFAGLVLRDKEGRITQSFSNEQTVDTRDEYILVTKNVGTSESYLRAGTLEACVFDGIEEVSFEFELSNLRLATEAAP